MCCVPHLMFRPLLHRDTYNWYSCVRKGAVYLHIIYDIYADYYCAAFWGGRTKQSTILQSICMDISFCVRGTRIDINRNTQRRAAGKAAAATQQPNIQSVLCVQLTALLTASSSSSRGGIYS